MENLNCRINKRELSSNLTNLLEFHGTVLTCRLESLV